LNLLEGEAELLAELLLRKPACDAERAQVLTDTNVGVAWPLD
jgi:hypothetical protein